MDLAVSSPPDAPAQWAKVIDQTRCIGCHACTTACKSENQVPVGVTRTFVKYVDVGRFPHGRRAFQVTRCNQCDDPPCAAACPTAAMYRRPDGIVDFAKALCIGCKACIAACPYDAIFINPEDHSAEKCNFCAHRLDMGLEPACVVVCPTQAILVGDLHDEDSAVARMVQREAVTVRRPEKETRPKLFYRGAHQATLDPLAAARPDGGMLMWSEQFTGPQAVVSGHPDQAANVAAAMLSYDVPHKAPWDWRVSLYTWTKGIAAGAYLVPLLLLALVGLPATSPIWQLVPPILGGVFLGLTGLLLIWDLEHPRRFLLIFLHPQWKSWLVRGGFIIGGYAAVLAGHFAAVLLGNDTIPQRLIVVGLPLAVAAAIYTAYLLAQARARDLWQNPLLPGQLLVQAILLGSAAVLPVAGRLQPEMVRPLLWILGASSLVHLLLVAGEVTLGHATAHARLAVREMVRGRYRAFFLVGSVLTLAAAGAPWIGPVAAPLALIGVLAHEHAYIQAGQSVPLA